MSGYESSVKKLRSDLSECMMKSSDDDFLVNVLKSIYNFVEQPAKAMTSTIPTYQPKQQIKSTMMQQTHGDEQECESNESELDNYPPPYSNEFNYPYQEDPYDAYSNNLKSYQYKMMGNYNGAKEVAQHSRQPMMPYKSNHSNMGAGRGRQPMQQRNMGFQQPNQMQYPRMPQGQFGGAQYEPQGSQFFSI